MFGFRTHTTALWLMEQSSILPAKFDCPVARQNFLVYATAHDCETGFFPTLHLFGGEGAFNHLISITAY